MAKHKDFAAKVRSPLMMGLKDMGDVDVVAHWVQIAAVVLGHRPSKVGVAGLLAMLWVFDWLLLPMAPR